MITFWIAAALLSALAALPILAGAARGAKVGAASDEDPTLALHRRQLAEIDELAGRGLLSDEERASARAEAGRRLLAAADTKPQSAASSTATRRLVVIGAVVAPLLGLVIYLFTGSPADPDQPFLGRLAGWTAQMHADPAQLRPDEIAALLVDLQRRRPQDPEPSRNLATVHLEMGDAGGAVVALNRAVTIAPNRADLWLALAQADMAQADGVVDEAAASAFTKALALQPGAPLPRYYLARRKIADGQVAEGLAEWRALLPDLPSTANSAIFKQEIDSVAATGRLPVETSPAEAQQQVGPEQIAAMVEGLAARLKAQPDDPQGWVRLVRAYTVMGETAKRDAALAEARARYKNKPDILSGLESAAHPGQ